MPFCFLPILATGISLSPRFTYQKLTLIVRILHRRFKQFITFKKHVFHFLITRLFIFFFKSNSSLFYNHFSSKFLSPSALSIRGKLRPRTTRMQRALRTCTLLYLLYVRFPSTKRGENPILFYAADSNINIDAIPRMSANFHNYFFFTMPCSPRNRPCTSYLQQTIIALINCCCLNLFFHPKSNPIGEDEKKIKPVNFTPSGKTDLLGQTRNSRQHEPMQKENSYILQILESLRWLRAGSRE